MTPREIELINAIYAAERLIGKIHKLMTDTEDLLDTAVAANKRGRTEVVRERLEYSLHNLRSVKLQIADFNKE